jgi:hypothetical protein
LYPPIPLFLFLTLLPPDRQKWHAHKLCNKDCQREENDGEVNVLRVLTVPDQTSLRASAGVAFADAAGPTIGKFSFFNNSHFLSLLDQLSCPIIIARQFNFPTSFHYL